MSTETSIPGKNGKKSFTITIRESDIDSRKSVTIDPASYGLSEYAAMVTREELIQGLEKRCVGWPKVGFFRECLRVSEILRDVEGQGITSCIYETS